MAGGTHVFDMIKRLKENENLRKMGYFKAKSAVGSRVKTTNVDHKVATHEILEQVRIRTITERRKDSKRIVRVLILSMLVTFVLILCLFALINLA